MTAKPLMYVYHLRHVPTGKIYSGKTINLEKQKNYQFTLLKMRQHKSKECQELYNVNSDLSEFVFDIEVCRDQEQADLVLTKRLKETRENGLSLNSNRFLLDAPDKGVYQIKFPDGSFYLGSTKGIRGRLATHDWCMRKGKHKNARVQAKYLEFDGLYETSVLAHTGDDYRILEKEYLDKHFGDPLCLNLASDPNSPGLELWQDDEYRAKQSAALEKRWTSDEARISYGEKMRAYWNSPKAKEKRSGGNNPFAKQISVDGVVYGSFAEAKKGTGLSRFFLEKRLKDDKDTAVFYV